jgi:anti-sigma factor RsiW
MNCTEAQQVLPIYLDGQAAPQQNVACQQHLRQCPVCRAELEELRALSRDLTLLSRPAAPPNLAASINFALAQQALARPAAPRLPLTEIIANWARPRLLPYAVGSLASVLLFATSFLALRSSLTALNDWDYAQRASLARDSRRVYGLDFPGYDISQPITPEGLAILRRPVAGESPTLNPKGALLSLMRSLTFDDADDEMMVVTDIFSDGRATISGVMQPPRDPRLLRDVQQALRKNPAFVPAAFDNRPSTIRVVFVVQSVDVREQ